jgi:uncharacterized protein (DUF1810 family)
VADPGSLQRFVDAQSDGYRDVTRELTRGRKQTHWMWFVFPQLKGLGHSATAQHFGIASLDEARSYLAHPVLGPRLRECAGLLQNHPGRCPIELILGSTDALKLRSSMTLFVRASAEPADRDLFAAVLDRYYGGEPDPRTLAMLSAD